MSKVWHIVVFRTAAGVGEQDVDRIRGMFERCVGPCDGLEWVRSGTNNSASEFAQGWPEAIVMQFRDRASRDAYLVHPLHREVSQVARATYYTDLVVVDMDVEDTPAASEDAAAGTQHPADMSSKR